MEASLARGETAVKELYGGTFAFRNASNRLSLLATVSPQILMLCIDSGVMLILRLETALGALQEVPTHLQEEIIANLKAHWQQGASIDFTAL